MRIWGVRRYYSERSCFLSQIEMILGNLDFTLQVASSFNVSLSHGQREALDVISLGKYLGKILGEFVFSLKQSDEISIYLNEGLHDFKCTLIPFFLEQYWKIY